MSTSTTEGLSPLKRAIIEIRELRERQRIAELREREPIAIVGMGMRFPGGAVGARSFWQLLSDGTDAIREVPADRWPAADLYDDDPDTPGRMNTRWGGFLDDIDAFDAQFFGISRREAESLDPQQRLLLEVTWEALEDAGIPADSIFGSNAGVFLGIGNSDYLRMLLADPESIDSYTTTGGALSVAAGRLAYVLGAQGPALAIDTACSSSLVAVHLAVQSLRRRECDTALAGGVNLILAPELTMNFSRARMMAPDGRCKTFDAAADGYVRSEGCGMVALRRLSDAEAAGDRVLAVVLGSAVNQDGRSGGLTAPNGPSQEHVVESALHVAQVSPEQIDYVEAHGTGTLLGDPIEIGALGNALCAGRSDAHPLVVGSVKTNIGHTEAAAGIAGLSKLVLSLRHGEIPAHLHLQELNPHIGGHPIEIPTTSRPWPRPGHGRLGGVSSFGLSGTNAHVIVGEAPEPANAEDRAAPPSRTAHVVTISARSDAALSALAQRHLDLLAENTSLTIAELAFATNTDRAHLERRLALVADDIGGVGRQLESFVAGDRAPDDVETFRTTPSHVGIGVGPTFVYTGHGSHYAGMGRQLYDDEPVFAAAIERCAELLTGRLECSITDVLFGDGDLLDGMAHAQPALFCLQYALTELWASWGVRPSIVAGHSAGEYVAAVVAGILDLEAGLELICARGRLMQSLGEDGVMVALFADEASVDNALEGRRADVGIAAVNGPTTTVISGRRQDVEAVIADLALDDDEVRPLDISVAAHSPLVEPILDEFERAVGEVRRRRPEIGLVSSMTGSFVVDEPTSPAYWRRHLREPVRFADVFATLHAAGCNTFVEIGPHPTLLGLGRRTLPDPTITWAASMRRDTDERRQIAGAVGAVYAAGATIDWHSFHQHGSDDDPRQRHVDLPHYAWQRQSYWSDSARSHQRSPTAPLWHSAVSAAEQQADQGPLDLRADTFPERWDVLDRLATAYIVQAFREMGVFVAADESWSVEELLRDRHFASGYEHLAGRWLGHLADDGLLTRAGDRYTSVSPLREVDVASPRAAAYEAFAGSEPLVDYVVRCGEQLTTVVGGQESALGTLFPDGDYDTVDFLYKEWAVLRYFNSIVRAAAAAIVSARPTGTIRFLEVGAGTGGTSASVLPALPPGRTSYAFTDVSDFFLARAADRFAEHAFVTYGVLDIERSPAEQGYAAGSFDVIVAANVLHATVDLDVTLRHVRSLLAPGGVLLALEGTAYPRWPDVTTGLIEGWQRFEDSWRTDVPLIDAATWTEALLAADFSDVAALPRDGAPTDVLLHDVIIARASGEELAAADATPDVGAAAAREVVSAIAVPPADRITEQLAEAMPDERHDVFVDVVRRAVAHVLRSPDLHSLRRDQPLLDLGFDSLMAVELRDVLRRAFDLAAKLPATLAFDHPTIDAIAVYLEGVGETSSSAQGGTADRRAPSPADPVPSDVAALTEDEVEAALLARLADIE